MATCIQYQPIAAFGGTDVSDVDLRKAYGEDVRAELLRVTQFHTSHIEGLSSTESEAIIQDLFGRLYSEDNMYAHRWKQGDLVAWNNIAIQHGRKPFQGLARAARRTLCRVAVMDQTVPQIMEGVTYNSTGGFKVKPAMA